ncbi:MAG: crotonase/enoyl-CoA hydratase family protein [Acidimicrobiales bacterium]
MTTTSEVLSVERADHVATLWLDRPEQRNALGSAFFDDLPVLMGGLSEDPDVRVVVIAARGPAFTVGLDLKAMGGLLGGGEAANRDAARTLSDAGRRLRSRREIARMQASISAVADCPKPTIAAVHGWCLGGGVDLITACDIRLASADAVFSVRETRIAIVADLGTLQRLPRILSPGHVAELAYTGRDIDAERAMRIGLINEVAPDVDALHATARALAIEIAANSPLAVQGTKAVLRAGEDRSVAEGLEYVALWNSAFLQSEDLREAMTAFMEKRPASFTGS